jgi:hypothetical protein
MRCQAQIVIADAKCQVMGRLELCGLSGARERGRHNPHGDALFKARAAREQDIFGDEAFTYDPVRDIYRCPAGQVLRPPRMHPVRRTIEYKGPSQRCVALVFSGPNARAPTMDALCSDMKNKRPWM